MAGVLVSLAVALPFLILMAILSVRAARVLPPEGPVPIHFDFRGKADGFGTRRFILWLMPIIYLLFGGLMVWADMANDPSTTAGLALATGGFGLVCLTAHAFVMGLLHRWAAEQR